MGTTTDHLLSIEEFERLPEEDAFRVELNAFHHSVTTGEKPKTILSDSLADLELFAEVGQHFLRQ